MFYMLVAPLHRAVKINRIVLDNQIFRLHYKATSLLLLMFSILVTSTQYFGEPIDCIQHDSVPANVIRTFCWIHSTFNVPAAFNATVGVDGVPHPGIQKYTPDEVRRYYGYYQWVCMVLFLQAACFYVPRYLWKCYEQGLIRSLVQDLDCPIKEDADVCRKTEVVARYVRNHLNMHGRYFGWYVTAEVLNFVNVLGQILLTDAFLGNMFTTFGTDVLNHHNEDPDVRNDPYDLGVPAHHQVFLPPVRFVWRRDEARRPVPARAEHHQREDLHLPLVLVGHPSHAHGHRAGVPPGDHRVAEIARDDSAVPGAHGRPSHARDGHQARLHLRLVSAGPSLQEHEPGALSHLYQRARQVTGGRVRQEATRRSRHLQHEHRLIFQLAMGAPRGLLEKIR
ncbi:hypothetical protein MRX96_054581 [Rhipicephalus microplus]